MRDRRVEGPLVDVLAGRGRGAEERHEDRARQERLLQRERASSPLRPGSCGTADEADPSVRRLDLEDEPRRAGLPANLVRLPPHRFLELLVPQPRHVLSQGLPGRDVPLEERREVDPLPRFYGGGGRGVGARGLERSRKRPRRRRSRPQRGGPRRREPRKAGSSSPLPSRPERRRERRSTRRRTRGGRGGGSAPSFPPPGPASACPTARRTRCSGSAASGGGSVRRLSPSRHSRAGAGFPRGSAVPARAGAAASPPKKRSYSILRAVIPRSRSFSSRSNETAIVALDSTGLGNPRGYPSFDREAPLGREGAGARRRPRAPSDAGGPSRGGRPGPAGRPGCRPRRRRRDPRRGESHPRVPPSCRPEARRERHGGPSPHESRTGAARRRRAGSRSPRVRLLHARARPGDRARAGSGAST